MDQKYSLGIGKEDGSVRSGHIGNREGSTNRAYGSNDPRACTKKQGDPLLPCRIDNGPKPRLGHGQKPRRDCQQGPSLQQTHGNSRAVLGLTNLTGPGQVFKVNKGPIKGNLEAPAPKKTPRRERDPGVSESPTTTIYEVVGKVELIPVFEAIARPSQAAGT